MSTMREHCNRLGITRDIVMNGCKHDLALSVVNLKTAKPFDFILGDP